MNGNDFQESNSTENNGGKRVGGEEKAGIERSVASVNRGTI